MEDPKKKRCQKTTRQQYMLYMEMLESSEIFRSGKINPTNQTELERLWEQLVERLNCSGGPQKDAAGWKKIFSDWKSAVRKKARQLRMLRNKTGGGPAEKPLSDLEEKLIGLLGTAVVYVMENVPELGVQLTANREEISSQMDTSISLDIAETQNKQEALTDLHTPTIEKTLEENSSPRRGKKRMNLGNKISSLVDVVNKNSDPEVLASIDNTLKNMLDIEKQRLQVEQEKLALKKIKIALQYPEYHFQLE